MTAVSAAVADSLVRDYGVERARVRVVPNGAEPPDEVAERPAVRRLREELGAGVLRPLWVCAGRLEEQKGQDVLLDALAEVRRRGLEFVAVLAGEGRRRAALEERARALGLEANVRFAGQVEDVGPLLAAADAVVLPSRWEGMPLVLLEALARGRPVVASAVGGVPEVVTDGEHARLVPPGDVAALAEGARGLPPPPRRGAAHGLARGVAGPRATTPGSAWSRRSRRSTTRRSGWRASPATARARAGGAMRLGVVVPCHRQEAYPAAHAGRARARAGGPRLGGRAGRLAGDRAAARRVGAAGA